MKSIRNECIGSQVLVTLRQHFTVIHGFHNLFTANSRSFGHRAKRHYWCIFRAKNIGIYAGPIRADGSREMGASTAFCRFI